MSLVDRVIRFCLDNRLVTALFGVAVILWGVAVAPFEWEVPWITRAPVPVDAIPDIGENQQIVFTRWEGRSPQDIEDQITYPLTVSLLGVPGVKTIRSSSMFGFSSIYVVFEEKVDFYWSRSRILEKLGSLPAGTLPDGVQPAMGPDATALGQIYWYTLEGRDPEGNPAGGWDLQELRTIQDWYVRYALMSAEGVSEVASVGGFVREYQVNVDPNALWAHGITLSDVYMAVKNSNLDVGARTIELNNVEYVVRGIGFVKRIADLEEAVVRMENNVPITIADVAKVGLGPALRRGVLDKGGAEAVGGVVVARYGENPLETIKNVKGKVARIAPGLPRKKLDDGTISKVTIVPFYDRTGLIRETLGTLNTAIYLEVLVTLLVILVMLNNLRSSLIISAVLPIAVLMSFIGMKLFGVVANIVSLSGIAIAIGTIVSLGIFMSENVLRHLGEAGEADNTKKVVFRAASEVGGALWTAGLTTVVSFLPVFAMQAAEGKLFKPLAYTKTFALVASMIISITILPPLLHAGFGRRRGNGRVVPQWIIVPLAIAAGIVVGIGLNWLIGMLIVVFGVRPFAQRHVPSRWRGRLPGIVNGVTIAVVGILLTADWLPLGASKVFVSNLLFVALWVGGLLWFFHYFMKVYPRALEWFLGHKVAFMVPAVGLVVLGMTIWIGFPRLFFFVPNAVYGFPPFAAITKAFPGLGKEFMPPLDEGSYLYMPTTMTHASIGEVRSVLHDQNLAIRALPEVESAVGKLGRVESALDPAPISMIETVVNIKDEYIVDEQGRRMRFKFDRRKDTFVRDSAGKLVPDSRGRPYRQWREHIEGPDDIWEEIVRVAELPGVTTPPKLQPIATRVVMLQTGMRAPMGIKVHGPDLRTIERFGLRLEQYLKQVPSVDPAAVYADRIIGKPYLEAVIDRKAIARYGISVRTVQNVIEVALGGKPITTTVEGRERYNVRVRYPRELRGLDAGAEDMEKVLVATRGGSQVPLGELAGIEYRRGPQVIKSEDTFLTGHVVFDAASGVAEVDAVNDVRRYLREKIESGELVVPGGLSYEFAGTYQNQVRSEKRLAMILPIALFIIFLILFFQFRSVATTLLVFAGILVAWSGGFVLIWLYGQQWFLDFPFLGVNLRKLFQMHQINLSVAIWVGFLALFGIATDNGVVICTYLTQRFRDATVRTIGDIRKTTVEAAARRIRPAVMTSATTILALLPVLTSTGRGADVMVPMAIPSFGGMLLQLVTLFLAPVGYCWIRELKAKRQESGKRRFTGRSPHT